MLTNLVATVTAICATNWTTVSHTTPVLSPEQVVQAVVRYDTLNQVGVVVTNYVATLVWKGKPTSVVVETVDAGQPRQQRSISEEPTRQWLYGTMDTAAGNSAYEFKPISDDAVIAYPRGTVPPAWLPMRGATNLIASPLLDAAPSH